MNKSRFFDPLRFWYLLKMELFQSRKAVLITIVITFGLLKVSFFLTGVFGNSLAFDDHAPNYTFFLLAGGFILSSMAFNNLGNPARKYRYLTLPASVFEKFLSMWSLTCMGWIIVFSLTYILYSWIVGSLGSVIFGQMSYTPFEIFSNYSLTAIRYYIVLQGVFLVAAVQFKGYAFPKTIFTLLITCFICGLIFYMILSDIFRSDLDWNSACYPFQDKNLNQFLTISHHIVLWILPPLSWVITYIGLKEQEA